MEAIIDGKDYPDLEEKVKKYLRAERVLDSALPLGMLLLITPFLISLLIASLFKLTITNLVFSTLIALGSVLAFLPSRWAGREIRQYRLDSNDWLHYYIYPIWTNLVKYVNETKSEGMRKKYRKKAIKELKGLIAAIERRWTVGQFSLAKEAVGHSVSDLVDGLRFRVIPAMETGDIDRNGQTGQINRVQDIITTLFGLSNNITYKGLERVNQEISRTLGDQRTMRTGRLRRWFHILESHRILRYSLAIGIASLLAYAFYSYLIYLGWRKEDILTPTIAFFGILMAAAIGLASRYRPMGS